MKLAPLAQATRIAAGTVIVLLAACGNDEADPETGGTPTGAAFDWAFIDAMVPHHEGAIEMA